MRVKRARSEFVFYSYIPHVQFMRGARGMIVGLGVKVPVGQRGLGRGAVLHISQSWIYGTVPYLLGGKISQSEGTAGFTAERHSIPDPHDGRLVLHILPVTIHVRARFLPFTAPTALVAPTT